MTIDEAFDKYKKQLDLDIENGEPITMDELEDAFHSGWEGLKTSNEEQGRYDFARAQQEEICSLKKKLEFKIEDGQYSEFKEWLERYGESGIHIDGLSITDACAAIFYAMEDNQKIFVTFINDIDKYTTEVNNLSEMKDKINEYIDMYPDFDPDSNVSIIVGRRVTLNLLDNKFRLEEIK